MKITIALIKAHEEWKQHKEINVPYVRSVVKYILSLFPNVRASKEVEAAILLTNDSHMQELNNQFRGKNKPTNTLSFPDMEIETNKILELNFLAEYINLGDIAFGYETIKTEAKEQKKDFNHHFTHLLVHGVLHLLGFDHENDEDAEVMEKLEIDILKHFLIESPY